MIINVTFDRAMITAQLEPNEDTLWGKHHQRWLENDLVSLKSDVFISSVERRPYQGSNYAFCARWGKGHVKSMGYASMFNRSPDYVQPQP